MAPLQPTRAATSIRIVDYDSRWPAFFEREATKVRAAIGDRARLVEHTGSTSVPGLAAKPIIDMLLVVANSADEMTYVPPLERAGFVFRLREPAWYEHRMFNGPDTPLNLHVFSEGCPEVARILTFRNWLRRDAADRDLYARSKLGLAQQEWASVDDYARAKTTVIEGILARAIRVIPLTSTE
jgi:GrpB-like predicted nucleotidyltransferase (UPF0157 family)